MCVFLCVFDCVFQCVFVCVLCVFADSSVFLNIEESDTTVETKIEPASISGN